jgi:molybdopterin molybdotransferase
MIRPKVGVIATGDELVPPGQRPDLSQIRESNSCQLRAQISRIGAIARGYPIAVDTDIGIHKILNEALEENDVVVLSGGVSMGEYDLVTKIMRKNGVEVLFERIAVKPGKPTVFGTHDNAACFGLPGNPVSAFVTCELLVKPFLYKMMGHNHRPRIVRAPLETTIKRKDTRRQGRIPVTITDVGTARPREYHGSAHIGALCGADGLLTVEVGVPEIQKGTIVDVLII